MKPKRSLLIRIVKWGVLIGATLVLVFVFLVAPYWTANAVTTAGTRSIDRELTSTPADYGLGFEDVSFRAADGVLLRGWYLDGGELGASIVCAHGLFRSRREVLDRAALFRKKGFSVLLFDSRRHGESGGNRATLGFKERLDVKGGIDFMRARRPHDRIVLFGVSMGAAASLLAAAERPEVAAVISDSSFLNLEQVVTAYLELLFELPRFPVGDMLLFFIARLGGFRKEELDVEEAVHRIGDRPILFLGAGEDRQAPPQVQRRLYRASKSRESSVVIFEGATHGASYRTQPDAYRDAVLDFLSTVVPSIPNEKD